MEKVNGQPVHRLAELNEALKKSRGDFNVFEFAGLVRLVGAQRATAVPPRPPSCAETLQHG